MESDIRKYTIILAVAILFSVFSFAFADAFTTDIEYPSECQEQRSAKPLEPVETCEQPEQITCEYGEPLYLDWACEWTCNCYEYTEDIRSHNDAIRFWVGIVLGGIAIIVGMLLNPKKKLNTWVGSGFILGGVITIFVATIGYWQDLHKIARPIIIALELGLVLLIAYRKFK